MWSRGAFEGLVRCWREPIGAGDGCSYEELTEAEYRLRSTLPIALRDAYGLLGRRADLTGVQDRPLPLEQLRIPGGALVFRWENQAVAEVAVRQEDQGEGPGGGSPAVVFRLDQPAVVNQPAVVRSPVPGRAPTSSSRPTTATRSRQTKKTWAAVAGSPRTSMPSTAAPATPMPTQTP